MVDGLFNRIITQSTPPNSRKKCFKTLVFSTGPLSLQTSIPSRISGAYWTPSLRIQKENELLGVRKEGWRDLPVDLFERLSDSMPRRIDAVIKARGFDEKYYLKLYETNC